MPRHLKHRNGGFTLIEASLTTVIIGTGVLAILAAQQAYHMKNDWAQRTGTAMLLANELREMTLSLPLNDPITGAATLGPEANEIGFASYDDIDDFAGPLNVTGFGPGTTFAPPINAQRVPIANLPPGWSQQINVINVLPTDIDANPLDPTDGSVLPLGTTPMMQVTVLVNYQAPNAQAPTNLAQLSWVVN